MATDWRARLNNLLHYSDAVAVDAFIAADVGPAMATFASELRQRGLDATVEQRPDGKRLALMVGHGTEADFRYEVRRSAHLLPNAALRGNDSSSSEEYYRAEVFLKEGGQGYDLMGWTREQVLHDLLEQYEKHLHFLHTVR